MNIALALSGGGFRATVFHLGVLMRLAAEDRLEEVTFLSTVSGGSLCTGLIFALNDFKWPSSATYREHIIKNARRLLTTRDLQRSLAMRTLISLWNVFDTRADDISALMRKEWGVTARLSDLPEQPRWMINATCYETGKNWRFERFRMGDYVFGYSNDTDIPLSDAMAASAGFPGLIGPLVLETTGRRWFNYRRATSGASPPTEAGDERKTETIQPAYREVHLWDGGVYDNHGLEALHDFHRGWREGVEFLIVSDAAGRATSEGARSDRHRDHDGPGALAESEGDSGASGQSQRGKRRGVLPDRQHLPGCPAAGGTGGRDCRAVPGLSQRRGGAACRDHGHDDQKAVDRGVRPALSTRL